MDYGKSLRVIRAAFGLRQAEVAELLEISPSLVSLIEAGKRPATPQVIETLAEVLRIPISLVKLLALEPEDLEREKIENVRELSDALLRLLVTASRDKPEPRQVRLRFAAPKSKT